MATHTKTTGENPSINLPPLEGAADYLDQLVPEDASLLDLILPLAKGRKIIALWVISLALLGIITAFLLPVQFTAITMIMPPQQAQGSTAAMLGQLGALAGLANKDISLKNPGDLYIGILKSRSIADNIIHKFDLQNYYRSKYLSVARKKLENDVQFDSGKDTLITVKVTNKDPKRAAEIANAFVDQLYAANQRLAISEASQRRLFFEKQLEVEKDRLADAEVDLKKTQESTGLIEISGQADAIIRSVAQMQGQLAAKEVQLQSMMSFATTDNPDVIRTQQEIAALRAQLAKLERNNKLGSGNIAIPTGKIPEAGLEYIRKLREVKYHEALFEMLAKQYEAAKIDEGKNAPIIQVIDPAIVPDRKSGPLRAVIILCSLIAGLMIGCLHIWMVHSYHKMQQDPQQRERLLALRNID